MSQVVDYYEYMDVNAIDGQLKCINCTQPFRSPVIIDCEHTSCQHTIRSQPLVTNIKPDSLSEQLDSSVVQCPKCNKTNIQRADLARHLKRCSEKKTLNLFRWSWRLIKLIIELKTNQSTQSTACNNTIDPRQPAVRHRSVRLNQRTPPVLSVTANTVGTFLIGMLYLLIAVFIGIVIAAIVLLFILISPLIFYKLFWQILAVIFSLWCGLYLTGISLRSMLARFT